MRVLEQLQLTQSSLEHLGSECAFSESPPLGKVLERFVRLQGNPSTDRSKFGLDALIQAGNDVLLKVEELLSGVMVVRPHIASKGVLQLYYAVLQVYHTFVKGTFATGQAGKDCGKAPTSFPATPKGGSVVRDPRGVRLPVNPKGRG
jgi:hypothetical protein